MASSHNPPTRCSQGKFLFSIQCFGETVLRLAHRVGSSMVSSRNPPTVLRLASPPPWPSGFKSQTSHCASIGFTTTTATVIIINFFEPPPVTMFSVYCERKFEVEPVEVIYSDGKSSVYPDLSLYHMEVPLSYVMEIVGVPLEANKVAGLLNKMQLHAKKSDLVDKWCTFIVSVPPTRSDILHLCDVVEDVVIAFGYNEIPKRIPTSLKPLPLNQFSDLIRSEVRLLNIRE